MAVRLQRIGTFSYPVSIRSLTGIGLLVQGLLWKKTMVVTVKEVRGYFTCFDTIHERVDSRTDGQTDERTDGRTAIAQQHRPLGRA